jgi:hypothetical protein
MICPKCGAENPENAYFCGSCGYQLKSAMEQPQGPATLGRPADPQGAKPLDTSAPGAGLLPPPAQPPYTPPAAPYAPPQPYSAPVQASTPPEQPPQYIPATQYAPADSGPSQGSGAYTPPPAQPQYAPPAQTPHAAPPAQPQYAPADSAQYGPPPGSGYAPPAYSPAYGYAPSDGNTSGMGEGYLVPPGVKGWTCAGFIPFGIFAFANNNAMWGGIGILAHILGLGLIYAIVLGLMGREVAWKARRFTSHAEFEETMAAWHKWGLILLALQVVVVGTLVIFYIGIIAAVFMSAGTGL